MKHLLWLIKELIISLIQLDKFGFDEVLLLINLHLTKKHKRIK